MFLLKSEFAVPLTGAGLGLIAESLTHPFPYVFLVAFHVCGATLPILILQGFT